MGLRFKIKLPKHWLAIALAVLVAIWIIVLSGDRSPAQNQAATGQPSWFYAMADPSNFGERFPTDIYGNPVNNELIVVLHETVFSADSAIRFFKTPHPNEDQQSSYHCLIYRDGSIAQVVPFDKRAFGAGNSVFVGPNGPEAVKTHPKYPASVNNFAFHFSLETPRDGYGNGRGHSGYTPAQYHSLALLVDYVRVPNSRITTHQAVDRSGTRRDPRSFNAQLFWAQLNRYRRMADNPLQPPDWTGAIPQTLGNRPGSSPSLDLMGTEHPVADQALSVTGGH
jgi:hypothetical protein